MPPIITTRVREPVNDGKCDFVSYYYEDERYETTWATWDDYSHSGDLDDLDRVGTGPTAEEAEADLRARFPREEQP